MQSFGSTAWSSVGKKVITGITGFLLMGFIIVHLLGNLTIFIGPDAFNHYAHFLESLVHGWFIYVFEAGLIAVLVFHMVSAVAVAWTDKRRARKEGYKYAKDAGGASRKTLASRTMIYGGVLIIVFIIGHVYAFKFGDHEVLPGGVKNLYKTVAIAFQKPEVVVWYVFMMTVLGFHLRHGFWSAFQSLGWADDRWLPLLVNAARVFAVLMAMGFIALPIYMFFFVDPASASAAAPGGH
jgi:succinate dehydrogenase / fumarate reductase cytochrome b subunit